MDTAAVQERFARLQNGSDVRGVALPGIPDEPVTLTPNAAFCLARAFAESVRDKQSDKKEVLIAVGRDPRLSGPAVVDAALRGINSTAGAKAVDAGLATTPAMYMATQFEDVQADGAFMVTASHLPWNRNGMKFFTNAGGASKQDIKALVTRASEVANEYGMDESTCFDADTPLPETSASAAVDSVPLIKEYYAKHCQEVVRNAAMNRYEALTGSAKVPAILSSSKPLENLRIVVDAGNGCGGFLASEVLAPLGADVNGSAYLDPDGNFPNHIPNPEDETAMASAVAITKAASAHMGICLDTDCDRSAVVARSGAALNRNRLIAAMSALVLSAHPGTAVVTDSVTSNGLRDFIESLGGRHVRYKRGYKNVIDKGVELGSGACQLMMETSGHGALAENFYLDDGLFMALLLVGEVAARAAANPDAANSADFDPLGELVANLREPVESVEYRLGIQVEPGSDFRPVGEAALESFKEVCADMASSGWVLEDENYEGYRARIPEGDDGEEGWALLRMSLHDPLCVLNVESDKVGGHETTLQILKSALLEKQVALDLSALSS